MRAFALALCFVIVQAGCQQDVVRRGAHRIAGTASTLYYEQVLDNVAKTIANPNTLPYFGVPAQGTHTNSRQLQASYTPEWDLNAARIWLFDKQFGAFAGQVQNQESLQLQPVTNPDKLLLMQIAYWQAIGYPHDVGMDVLLRKYYGLTNNLIDYNPYVKSGWFEVTKKKKIAKKAGCYVAESCGTYVYVTPANLDAFSKFTLAIMDIATLDINYFYGVKKTPGDQSEELPAPRKTPTPFPPVPIAPSL